MSHKTDHSLAMQLEITVSGALAQTVFDIVSDKKIQLQEMNLCEAKTRGGLTAFVLNSPPPEQQ